MDGVALALDIEGQAGRLLLHVADHIVVDGLLKPGCEGRPELKGRVGRHNAGARLKLNDGALAGARDELRCCIVGVAVKGKFKGQMFGVDKCDNGTAPGTPDENLAKVDVGAVEEHTRLRDQSNLQ